MRHPLQGAAQYASDCAKVPIANAGDGAGHHPTQTMLDLFTIKQAHNKIENLNVVLVGDQLETDILAAKNFNMKSISI